MNVHITRKGKRFLKRRNIHKVLKLRGLNKGSNQNRNPVLKNLTMPQQRCLSCNATLRIRDETVERVFHEGYFVLFEDLGVL